FYDDYGGQLTNFGVHYLDMIHWALGQDTPLAVTAMGGKFALADNREVPDTLEVLWTYPGNTLVTFSQFNATAPAASLRRAEIEFRGLVRGELDWIVMKALEKDRNRRYETANGL